MIFQAMTSTMSHTTMEQTLPEGWPNRLIITVTAYVITRVWEAGTRFILSLLTVVEVLKTTLAYFVDGESEPRSLWTRFSSRCCRRSFHNGSQAGPVINLRCWEAVTHAGCHAHRGRSIQPGDADGYGTDQLTGALIPIISPGGTYAYELFS